jgi:hypothetical protein
MNNKNNKFQLKSQIGCRKDIQSMKNVNNING